MVSLSILGFTAFQNSGCGAKSFSSFMWLTVQQTPIHYTMLGKTSVRYNVALALAEKQKI